MKISVIRGKKMRKIIYILFLITFVANAQEKDKNLPKGNEDFQAKKYADAETEYRLSQAKFAKKAQSSYNLGTTIYKQKQSSEAKYQFQKAIVDAKTRPEKHKAFHNFGNTLMNEKNYQGAVEAYKNALRNDPSDEETRYNYALAKKMLKENPPKKDDKKDDKKDKNKDKDKKEDKKDEPKKDKKDDPKKDEGDKKDKQDEGQNPQPKPNDVSKQKIENLLNAVNNEEKKVQDKVKAQKVKAPVKNEKDW